MPKIAASERDAFYESRRAELAAVALKLWGERGFDQTSVAAIAREAGLSKGTFYLYFETKQALLEEVLRRNSLVPNIQRLVAGLRTDSLEDAVRAFVKGAWRHLSDHRDLALVVLRELPTHLEEARKVVERVIAPANRLLADYLAERLDPARAERLSLVIAGRSLLGLVLFAFITHELLGLGRHLPVSDEAITDTLAEMFLRGVGVPEPAPTPAAPAVPAEGGGA